MSFIPFSKVMIISEPNFLFRLVNNLFNSNRDKDRNLKAIVSILIGKHFLSFNFVFSINVS